MLVLSGLPRSALARRESKLALASVEASKDLPTDIGVASELIDAALISHGPDSSTAVVDTVLDILKEQVSEVDGTNKRHWATDIQKLTNATGRPSNGIAVGVGRRAVRIRNDQ
ncbi:MAG: hypothetical protein IPO43_19995 [Rhodoferax sp.]|nr:hypothetical protein [Rhodoferax sp.]